jgi:hypothetical protein
VRILNEECERQNWVRPHVDGLAVQVLLSGLSGCRRLVLYKSLQACVCHVRACVMVSEWSKKDRF